MFRTLQILLLVCVAVGGLVAVPAAAAARPGVGIDIDPYWNGYWSWYDRVYRPYYFRHRYDGYYGSRDYLTPNPNYDYRDGYYRYPYRGGQVRVGPFGVYWR